MSEAAKPWAPEKCPITQRPLFMWIEHHKTGEMVPTYGGPYDSYTLAEFDGEDFVCERFDHDAGGWLVDCVEGLGVKLVDDQSLVIDPNNTRYDEIEAFAAAPVAAQTDVTQQTLNDVMAGIPARDAEIEALRKEIEALQAAPVKPYSLDLDPAGIRALTADAISGALALGFQGVSPPPNNEHWLAPFWEIGRESAVQAQQPVSGADDIEFLGRVLGHISAWLPEDWSEFLERNPEALKLLRPMVNHQAVSGADGMGAAVNAFQIAEAEYSDRMTQNGILFDPALAVEAGLIAASKHLVLIGQTQLSGNPGQLDHLPDATKMVGQDRGDSWSGWACQYPGKLPRLYGDKAIAELNHHPEEGDRLFQLAECTQQDADALTVDDYKKVLADSDRLTAELGRLLMGDDAPTQPRLCDLVSFAQNEGIVLAGQQDASLIRMLCETLDLARTCHGAILMSDPPKEMWKVRGVDQAISKALHAAGYSRMVGETHAAAQQKADAEKYWGGNQHRMRYLTDHTGLIEITARDEATCNAALDAVKDALAPVPTRQDADKVDAERYRALRSGETLFKRLYSGAGDYKAVDYSPLTNEQLDFFSDAARKGKT